MKKESHCVALGDPLFTFAVYIGNQPDMSEYQYLERAIALNKGDISTIGKVCGNGWRKVFNVYAKLLYALDQDTFSFSTWAPTWQDFRDQFLLQAGSRTALIFSAPQLNDMVIKKECDVVHLICGKTYAKQLIQIGKLNCPLTWIDQAFAINLQYKVVICPYFDYRQLSDHNIKRLASMLSGLLKGEIVDLA